MLETNGIYIKLTLCGTQLRLEICEPVRQYNGRHNEAADDASGSTYVL